jgi:hypothetical protein
LRTHPAPWRNLEIAAAALARGVDARDLRDPAAERRARRLTAVAVVVLVSLAFGAAAYAALGGRPIDHHYRYLMTYENTNGASFVLRVPLPADAEWQADWSTMGELAAAVEETAHGRVLRVEGRGNVSAAAWLHTWRDLPLTLTTEVLQGSTTPSALVGLETTGTPRGSFLNLTVQEVDPSFTTERFVQGDLAEGWSTLQIREEFAHA